MSRVRFFLLSVVCSVGMIAATVVALPSAASANPNPIDWRVYDMFSFSFGIPMPLRYGQHDNGDEDGFGKYHIEDGHAVVPPHEDIQETINLPAPACATKENLRHVCVNEDLALVVVFTENIDRRSGDGIGFGIITAYYYIPCFATVTCAPPLPGKTPSTLAYTGPGTITNGAAATLSASLSDNLGMKLTGQPVRFVLGAAARQQECIATTDTRGTAACTVTVNQPPASPVPLTVSYDGNADVLASSVSTTLNVQTPTTLTYTGPHALANGEPAALSAVLKDFAGGAVAGRTVGLSIGSGATQQSCTATTAQDGTGRCSISEVRQPLTDTATVPLVGIFAGDGAYLPSTVSATLVLQYFTGQAYGIAASLRLPLLPVTVPQQPDTGPVRTADATTTTPPCSATVNVIVLSARTLCASFVTTLNPGTATATASLQQTTIGLPGLPVIALSGVQATAVARCGAATGSTTLTVAIGGVPIDVPTAPNSVVALPGGAKLIVNEQRPVDGADYGLTVTAAHLLVAGGLGDVVVASTTSAVHNCA